MHYPHPKPANATTLNAAMKKTHFLLLIAACCVQITYAQKTVAVSEFDKKLTDTPNAQLLDVRTPEEFAGGHLKNAVNSNVQGGQFKQYIQTLDKTKPVFVYCMSGGRSSQAAQMLARQGFAQVYNLDGGYMKWSLADKPVAGAPPVATDEFSVNQLDNILAANDLVLIDFNAKWCGPCKKLLPVVEKLGAEYGPKLKLLKLDVDKNKSLVKARSVDALPNLMLFSKGKLVWQQVGMTDEKTIRAAVDKQL